MKSLIMFVVLLWASLVIEMAWPGWLPHGCLLFPVICGTIFWLQSPIAVIVTGMILLADWILRPGTLPLTMILVPLLSAAVLSGTLKSDTFVRRRGLFRRIPQPLQLPAMVLAMVVLNQIADAGGMMPWTSSEPGALLGELQLLPEKILPVIYRALPVSGLISVVIRLADELGLRRHAFPAAF